MVNVQSAKAPPRVETERLVLVQPRHADVQAIFDRYASDPDATRFLGWPRHRSVADTETFIRFSADEWRRWPAGPYLIRSRHDGRLLGSTGLGFASPHEVMTGYVLAKDAWGQGFATEALFAVVNLARRLQLTRIGAVTHQQHRASQRVLEKCGFVRQAEPGRPMEFPNLAPGVWQDVSSYVLALTATGDAGRS
jgi:RimJ/RimL family protein N-acetyltransferase